jgi:predicted nucleic acid-binding protein
MVFDYFSDSDVILDGMLDRQPFSFHTKTIFNLSAKSQIKIFFSSIIFTNVYYIVNKTFGKKKANESLESLLDYCGILSVGETEIRKAYKSEFLDFEDGIQYQVALQHPGIKGIITRNKKDFKSSKLPVYSPLEFLDLFK